MSDETTAPAPTPQAPATPPESVSRGTAGDPTPPTLGSGKRDWVGEARAKLSANLGQAPAAPPPTVPDAPATPEAAPAAPDPSIAAFDALVAGQVPQAPAAPAEKAPALDGDMAQLAKIVELEQAARQRAEQLTERERALEADRAKMQGLMAAQQVLDAGGSKLEALQAMGDGWTYEALTQEVIGGKAQTGPMTQRLAELEKQLQEMPETLRKEYEQKLTAAQKQAEEAQVAAWNQQQAHKLRSDTERWGLLTDATMLQGRDPVEMVYQAMESEWERLGRPDRQRFDELGLTFDSVADKLESAMERSARSLATQPSKLSRILGLTPAALTAPPATPAPTDAGRSPDAPASQTLTTDLASRAPASPPEDRPRTRDDWMRQATEAAQQRLAEKR